MIFSSLCCIGCTHIFYLYVKRDKLDGCIGDGTLGQLIEKEINMEIITIYSKNLKTIGKCFIATQG